MIGPAPDAAVQIVDALSVASIPEALQIGDGDLRARFPFQIKPGIAVHMYARIQNNVLIPLHHAGKGDLLLLQQGNLPGDHVHPGNQPHALKEGGQRHRPVRQAGQPGGIVKIQCAPIRGRHPKIDALLHRAQIYGILGRAQVERIVQPHLPGGLSSGDGADSLTARVGDLPIHRQRVAVARADHAVNRGPGIRLILGDIRVVEQHLHGKDVFPRPQIGRQLHGFIILPVAIALAGAGQHGHLVHPQPIAGHRRDAGGQAGVCGQHLLAAEIGETSAQISVKNLLARHFFLGNPNPLRLFSHGVFLASFKICGLLFYRYFFSRSNTVR